MSPFEGPAGGTPLQMAQNSPTPHTAFYLNAANSSPPASLTSTTTSRKRVNGKSTTAKDGGPKRPANAYMIFCEQERDTVRERLAAQNKATHLASADPDDPDKKVEKSDEDKNYEMHKMLAQAWRELGSDGQRPWFEKYEERVDGYRKRLEEWNAQTTPGATKGDGGAASLLLGLGNARVADSAATPPAGGVLMETTDSVADAGEEDVEMPDVDGDEESVAADAVGGGFTSVN
jgi:non-histone protein 10